MLRYNVRVQAALSKAWGYGLRLDNLTLRNFTYPRFEYNTAARSVFISYTCTPARIASQLRDEAPGSRRRSEIPPACNAGRLTGLDPPRRASTTFIANTATAVPKPVFIPHQEMS